MKKNIIYSLLISTIFLLVDAYFDPNGGCYYPLLIIFACLVGVIGKDWSWVRPCIFSLMNIIPVTLGLFFVVSQNLINVENKLFKLKFNYVMQILITDIKMVLIIFLFAFASWKLRVFIKTMGR